MFARLNLERLVTAIVLVAVFAMAVRVPASPDTWWHLRCGEVQWQTRAVLKSDLFSHTAQGAPWVNQSWLPQLAMYGLWTLGGFPALALAVAALVAGAVALILAASEAPGRYGYLWRALVVIWAAISTGRVWAARPHLISFLLTAAWLYLLDRHRAGKPKALYWLPGLMALWANSHGGYIVGFLLLCAEIGGQVLDWLPARRTSSLWPRIKPFVLLTLLAALAASINPQGLGLLLFPFQTLSSPAQQNYVAEWASPDFHAADMLPFLGLLLATWSALVFSTRPVNGAEWLRLLGFSAMALRSGRYLGLCALVMAPLLAQHGAAALARFGLPGGNNVRSRPTRGHPAINWLLLALIVTASVLKIARPLDAALIERIHRQSFPVDAVDYMQQRQLPATLFNEYAWGGYLIWRHIPVFIDGRADPYGDALITAYRNAISAQPGWEQTLDSSGVHTALLAANSPLAMVMETNAGWKNVYRDDIAVLYVKTLAHR